MARRLNIMVVTQIPLWSIDKQAGGPALSQTVFGYARAGHTVHLVTPRVPYITQADLPDGVVLHTFKHTFHGFLIHIKKIGWLFDMAGWLVFQRRARRMGAKLLAREHFDVVYGYEVWGIPCARELADRFQIPMVSRFQGTWMKKQLGARFRDLRFHKHVRAFRTPADLYIMTDDGTQGDEVLAQFGVEESKLRFWRNGIETGFLQTNVDPVAVKAGFGIDAVGSMLMTLCRLVPLKGVHHAISAMPDIVSRFSEAKLVVAGEGPQRGELESLARDLKVDGAVIFTGALDRKRTAEVLAGADVFISMYDQSNVGNPLLEAMSCGRAIVTRDVGSTSEVISDGVNGVLLAADAVDALAGAVCDLLADKAKRANLGLRAGHWARMNLQTWDERMEMEIGEVTKLVEERGAFG